MTIEKIKEVASHVWEFTSEDSVSRIGDVLRYGPQRVDECTDSEETEDGRYLNIWTCYELQD